jgi:HSP20 family protein
MRRSPDVSIPSTSGADALADEIRRLFAEIERTLTTARVVQGECEPPIDVIETRDAVEVVMDLPGVPIAAVRILIKDGVAVVVGQKPQPAGAPPSSASFHLVERTFGRFVRAIHVVAAIDARRVKARLRDGELHLTLPKIAERRGCSISIPIEAA